MNKLQKHSCYILVFAENGYMKPRIYIVGVFKKKKQAEEYFKRMSMSKDLRDKYSIIPSKTYDYKEVNE